MNKLLTNKLIFNFFITIFVKKFLIKDNLYKLHQKIYFYNNLLNIHLYSY